MQCARAERGLRRLHYLGFTKLGRVRALHLHSLSAASSPQAKPSHARNRNKARMVRSTAAGYTERRCLRQIESSQLFNPGDR
jgi:hypothetical protein